MTMTRTCLTTLALLLLAGCHSPRVTSAPKPAAGTYPLDGYYRFSFEYVEGTRGRMLQGGAFVIADSQVLWSQPESCDAVPTPEGSEGHLMAWFECGRAAAGRQRLQYRIHRTDPINKSRWHADVPVRSPERVCVRYSLGTCSQFATVQMLRYVKRSGVLEVVRGLPQRPEIPPASPQPDRTLRARCDTVATAACGG